MSAVSIDRFSDALIKQDERLKAVAAGQKKILGYFCTYTPVELIHAAGFLPVRVSGGPTAISKADSLTPNFICPYLRASLEKALNGGYEYLSGIVQGYSCDVACGLAKIWEQNIDGEIFHTVPIPYNDSPASRQFFRSSVEELAAKLEAVGGVFTKEALAYSLELYGEIRKLILNLYEMRFKGELPLSAGDFLAVILAGFVTPPEDFHDMLDQLSAEVKSAEPQALDGVPILVSGSLVEAPKILEILEESGGRIVADDLCTGIRNFSPAFGEGEDPIERLIDRYINRFPCPARSRASDRIPMMLDLIERGQAKGVIFLFQKFCTPHLADHPTLTEKLKSQAIPSIAIEMEETGINEGQLRTRVQAFLEMIE